MYLKVIVDSVGHGDGQTWPDKLALPIEIVDSHVTQFFLPINYKNIKNYQ